MSPVAQCEVVLVHGSDSFHCCLPYSTGNDCMVCWLSGKIIYIKFHHFFSVRNRDVHVKVTYKQTLCYI